MTDWLQAIVELWLKQIELCRKEKRTQFGDTARRLWGYLGKNYRDLLIEADGYGEELPEAQSSHVRTRLNLSRDFISLMLPYVHEKLPHRAVSPRIPELPVELVQWVMMQTGTQAMGPKPEDRLRAWLMEHWLNYLTGEYNLYREARTSIQEGLVKGRGVVWHELFEGTTGTMVGSFYDTVDYLLIDADCRQYRDAGFIIRERHAQTWKLAEKYGIAPNKLRGSRESHMAQAARSDRREARDADRDICVYYEVWSRMGMGPRMKDWPDEHKAMGQALEEVGPNVHLAILPGLPYPLNLPPEKLTGEEGVDELKAAVEWPIAFYAERDNPWPCSLLDIYPNADNPWATSPLEACLPLLVFIDRVYTFAMRHVAAASKKIMVCSSELSQKILDAIVSGNHLEVVQHDGPAVDLKMLVHVLELPDLNVDLWQWLQAVERKFQDSSGMTPLMMGGELDRQMRSAEEAAARNQRASSRPDDYADAVVNWMSEIARKEGQATRLYTGPDTVAPLFGEAPPDPQTGMVTSPLSWMWGALVNTDDPAVAASDMQYVCESGSRARKNQQKRQQDAQTLVQTLMQPMLGLAMQGVVQPYNHLLGVLAEAMDTPLDGLMLAPPPPMMPGQGQEPPPEGTTDESANYE